MKHFYLLALGLIFCIITNAQITYLKATLSGSEEVPANASTASGIVIVKYNSTTKLIELVGDYQNLTTSVNGSHIHSPAAPGVNAGVIVTLANTGGTTGTLNGSATFTPAQESDLLAGLMYVNVHSATYPGGEIRGQLTTTTAGQTEFLTGRIQGAQQVPPNGSLATGSVTALLDKTTNMVYLTGSFSGLTTAATASHIHTGAANTSGGVIINLSATAATSGTIHVASAITAGDETLMMNNGTYVNIHNSTYPAGEIRGQLFNQAQLVYLKAIMQGSQEVPPNASPAKGTIIVKYNTQTNFLELVGDYQNLASTITASHIHSPAAVGVNASVLITLTNTGGTSGVLSGTATLTAPQESDLLAGLMYVNAHNAPFPGGEIRGQLTTTTAGSETQYLTGVLSGAQEVPSNVSASTGNVTAILDKITREVFVTANFSGLAVNATAAHIHRGPAGVSGPVVVNLSPTLSTSGTITGSAIVSASFADSMINGLTYVNIHNATFPGGEIRVQLGNQVLPVQLSYFNGYRQGNKIVLVWETAQELNLKEFQVEQLDQSTNNWVNKVMVSGRGGNSVTKYNIQDNPLTSGNDFVFYRIKMVDSDGKFSYSPIIKINFKDSKTSLVIAGNPVQNGLLRYTITGLSSNKIGNVSVVDLSGRVLLKSIAQGFNTNSLDISILPGGLYSLMIEFDGALLRESFRK